MAAAPFFSWPWEILGCYKYVIYGLFLGKAVYSKDSWCFHVFVACMLRLLMYNSWNSYSNMLFLTRNRHIVKKGVDFEQIDSEWHWENFVILQAIVSALLLTIFPATEATPTWNMKGVVAAIMLHVAISEPLFYYMHRCFHGSFLFKHYHHLHHSSPVPQPFTAGHATFLEHLLLTAVIGLPIISSFKAGVGSISLIYSHVLVFDLLRCLGHSNVEIIPHRIFKSAPFLKYLLYTPTYHSLHHAEMHTNYCLFMPIFDILGKTLNRNSWKLHEQNSLNSGKNGRVPDVVFLGHVVDMSATMHAPFVYRSMASLPYYTRIYLLPLLPVSFIIMLPMWAKSKTFFVSFYTLRNRLHQIWVVWLVSILRTPEIHLK